MVVVRAGDLRDAASLAAIAALCPQAGAWSADELRRSLAGSPRGCLVADRDGSVAGFLVAQCAVADEAEILAVAVEPAARRQGVARALVEGFLHHRPGQVFLEVRRSNVAAQRIYQACGFAPAGVRRGYYSSPAEDALIFRRRDH